MIRAKVYKGRKPSYSRKQFESAQAMLGKFSSVARSREPQGSPGRRSHRIKDDPAAAETALTTWGM